MNNNTQPRFYFSAYPLKVIGSIPTSNLRVMRTHQRGESGVHLHILPVANGVIKKISQTSLPYTDAVLHTNDDLHWFNNYE